LIGEVLWMEPECLETLASNLVASRAPAATSGDPALIANHSERRVPCRKYESGAGILTLDEHHDGHEGHERKFSASEEQDTKRIRLNVKGFHYD
jgi:hypothetical protein